MNLHFKNKPVISFCISTFNRSKKIVKLIEEILKYKGDEIEVVVTDNCSTDNTALMLSKIHDERFRYFVNNQNIGAIPNYMKSMSEAKGEYVFFSTDKDTINSASIHDLVDFFNNNSNIISGYCKLDVYETAPNVLFNQGVDGLKNMAYLSQHPTGYFFKNEILKTLNIFENYSSLKKIGTFPFEFIMADMCMLGQTAIVNLPLCYIETMEDVKNIKSYSYSGVQNNLYFSPFQRFKMLERYVKHLKTLDLPESEKKGLVKCIFRYGLSSATLGYRSMMQNKIICDHYSITTENIGVLKLIKNDYNFSSSFIINCKHSNFLTRIAICLEIHIEYILKKFKGPNALHIG